MPEGHTIHRLARLHGKQLAGHKLAVTSPQGRFDADAKRVTGRTLDAVDAHGKHLFYRFDNDLTVHVHLGMHGTFRSQDRPKGHDVPEPRGAVRMRLVGADKIVDLSGPTACEVIDQPAVNAIHARLGPDVLDAKADPEPLWNRVHRSRTSIGLLLMDQSVVAGIGNIYRAEVLYRQAIHPLTPGNALDRDQFDRLWADSVHLLKLGLKYGHIVTVDPSDVDVPLSKVQRDDRFLIYRRPTCRRCGAKVMQFVLAGRDCFLCSKEQRAPRGLDLAKFDLKPVDPAKRRRAGRDHGDAD